MGRPSDFSEETATTICERLIEGESLRAICKDDGMPHRSTVLRWLDAHPGFASRCAHARTLQADLMDEMILDTAIACTAETAPADRVKISAFQWRAAKLEPKKYGDSSTLKHTGAIGHFDPTKLTNEQLAQLEGVLGPIAAASGDAEAGPGGEGEEGS